jgi:hypothetical protein
MRHAVLAPVDGAAVHRQVARALAGQQAAAPAGRLHDQPAAGREHRQRPVRRQTQRRHSLAAVEVEERDGAPAPQVLHADVGVRTSLAVAVVIGREVAAGVRVGLRLAEADAAVRADPADVERLHPPPEAGVLLEARFVRGLVVDPEDPQVAVHERGRPVATGDLRLGRGAQREHRQHRQSEDPHRPTPTGPRRRSQPPG